MSHFVFIVGMAGTGKSTLTGAYLDWLQNQDQDVLSLNLDPGATSLPYNPDIDARNYVDIRQLMLDYSLGPNGALIMASDLLADHLEEMRKEIDEANPDMIIADTPGQIELFAFREGGQFIANNLPDENCTLIYLMDSPFTRSPLNFISNLYLAAAIYSRVMKPQIYALSKSDLVSEQELDSIITWTTEPETLDQALLSVDDQNMSLVTRSLADAVFSTGLVTEPIPVSSKSNMGLLELHAAVTRTISAGQEPTS
ncbi:MAG TPA: ATP/GTP-binding protein [Methylomirabilota bacterium]|nr:ATP/GTP-binding protein [Methylomirabilota bacterium]